MTVVTLVPAVVYLILVTDYRVLLDPKKVAILAGLVLLGAVQYLYVIVRAHQQPLLNELGPFSWRGWIHWMTRNRFPGQFFGFGLGDQVDRLRIYLELLEKQFFRWGYILGWIGAWERLKADLKSFVFLALVALGIYAFGMNYGGVTFRIYLIPTVPDLCRVPGLWPERPARAGWRACSQRAPRWLAWPLQSAGLAAIILVMPLYPLWQNWAEVDESDNIYYRTWPGSFVEQAGPDFVLVDSESYYDDLEAILYVAWAEKGLVRGALGDARRHRCLAGPAARSTPGTTARPITPATSRSRCQACQAWSASWRSESRRVAAGTIEAQEHGSLDERVFAAGFRPRKTSLYARAQSLFQRAPARDRPPGRAEGDAARLLAADPERGRAAATSAARNWPPTAACWMAWPRRG